MNELQPERKGALLTSVNILTYILHCDLSLEGNVHIFLIVKNVDAYSKTNSRYFQN